MTFLIHELKFQLTDNSVSEELKIVLGYTAAIIMLHLGKENILHLSDQVIVKNTGNSSH